MMEANQTFWDKVGMWLSYGCAVHCALMPFVVGYLAVNGMGWIAEESTEWAIITASLSIGLIRLGWSYFKDHKQPEPVVLFVMGVMAIFVAKSIFFETPENYEPVGMVAGGFMIGTAHFRNQAKCKCCTPKLVRTGTNG
ncbi:MAG: MerC domain-containing protein [Acidobacteriota bacterium]|jgi:predicted Na+-dependent transporter